MKFIFKKPGRDVYKGIFTKPSTDGRGMIVFNGLYTSFLNTMESNSLISEAEYNNHYAEGLKLGAAKGKPIELIMKFYFQVVVQPNLTFHVFQNGLAWGVFRGNRVIDTPTTLQNGDVIVLSDSIRGNQDFMALTTETLVNFPRLRFECSEDEIRTSAVEAVAPPVVHSEEADTPKPATPVVVDTVETDEVEPVATSEVEPTEETKSEEIPLPSPIPKPIPKPSPPKPTLSWYKKAGLVALFIVIGAVGFQFSRGFIEGFFGIEDPTEASLSEYSDEAVDSTAAAVTEPYNPSGNPDLNVSQEADVFAQVDQQLVDIDIKVTQGRYDEAQRMIEECKSLLATIGEQSNPLVQSRAGKLAYFESVIAPMEDDEQL